MSRLRESPGWDQFTGRREALLQAGLLEESQSRFGPAAELYEEIVYQELERPEDLRLESAYAGYTMRLADCLEKAGDSGKAAEIYWDLLTSLPEKQQTPILTKLIHNHRYGRPSQKEFDRLVERGSRRLERQPLSGILAQMFTAKGRFEEAVEIFSEFWPRQAATAILYIDEVLVAYRGNRRFGCVSDGCRATDIEPGCRSIPGFRLSETGRPREGSEGH